MKSTAGLTATLLPNLLAGLTSGLVTLVYTISFAALIFSGRLAPYFPQGVGIALIGATVSAIIVAWRSPFPFTLAGPEANSAVILALAGRSVASALDSPEKADSIYPTVWAAVALSTAITGLFLYLLGRFRLGQLARYVPYPVIGGFLAGTGWLITRSSFKVMTGIPLGRAELPRLFQPDVALQWLPGLAVAAFLLVVLNRFKHHFVLPGLLVGGIVLGNAAFWLAQYAGVPVDSEAWFFKPFANDGIWAAWNSTTLTKIDWAVLYQESGTLFALMAIVMLSILLNSTGLELATARNVDLNDELRANGVANLANGAVGGMIGYLSINRCLLNQQAGAKSPLAGMIAGGVCGLVLFFGSSFLALVPKPLLGGLLLFIGTNLLIRWVYQSRSQLPRFDYLLVILILTIVVTIGFIAGVGFGILIACLLFILSYGKTSSIKYTLSGKTCQSNVSRFGPQQQILEQEGDATAVLVLHGFIFFGTAHDLLDGIRRRLEDPHRPKLAYAVFDFRLVTGLDSSATLSFTKLAQVAEKAQLTLVFTQVSPRIEAQLRRGGRKTSGPSGVHTFPDLDRGLEWCENQILQRHSLLEAVSVPLTTQIERLVPGEDRAAELLQYLQSIELAEGRYLFHDGDAADGLYFLESGRVSVVIELPNGTTLRRRTYMSGAILGEMGIYSGAARSASVVADQVSRLHFLSKEAFARLETQSPLLAAHFNHGVVNLIADRLRRSENEVRTLLQ